MGADADIVRRLTDEVFLGGDVDRVIDDLVSRGLRQPRPAARVHPPCPGRSAACSPGWSPRPPSPTAS